MLIIYSLKRLFINFISLSIHLLHCWRWLINTNKKLMKNEIQWKMDEDVDAEDVQRAVSQGNERRRVDDGAGAEIAAGRLRQRRPFEGQKIPIRFHLWPQRHGPGAGRPRVQPALPGRFRKSAIYDQYSSIHSSQLNYFQLFIDIFKLISLTLNLLVLISIIIFFLFINFIFLLNQ